MYTYKNKSLSLKTSSKHKSLEGTKAQTEPCFRLAKPCGQPKPYKVPLKCSL